MDKKIFTSTFKQSIKIVAISPDCKFIAVACGKNIFVSSMMDSVFEWIPIEGHTGTITSIAWAPDGKTLASTSHDNTTCIWDVKYNFRLLTLDGLKNWSSFVSWSHDGKMIAVASWDKEKPIQILDPIGGECLMTLKDETETLCVFSLDWSLNNQLLASGMSNNTICIWNTHTGKKFHTLKGHTDWVYSVVWSPDGLFLASGSKDNTIRLWDMKTFNCKNILKGHSAAVKSLVWAPNSLTLASGSFDKTVRFWDVKTGKEEYMIDNLSYGVSSIAFSSNGETFAIANGNLLKQIYAPSDQKVQDVSQRKRKASEQEQSPEVSPQEKKARLV